MTQMAEIQNYIMLIAGLAFLAILSLINIQEMVLRTVLLYIQDLLHSWLLLNVGQQEVLIGWLCITIKGLEILRLALI